ncbi:flagellar hook-length control protein FliK [Oligella ureolytica]|uniref:Flagellar hook-length control protein FliK n=2 Tax=Oligella ureolytica TaxID=90244 RepID=A0A7T3BR62_9BURK|nr:flagellar hook-length control protein FliK [Oligella ureolytica]QPT39123.1 flagellar hook-length control protein FliK [Oligella ureolytica]
MTIISTQIKINAGTANMAAENTASPAGQNTFSALLAMQAPATAPAPVPGTEKATAAPTPNTAAAGTQTGNTQANQAPQQGSTSQPAETAQATQAGNETVANEEATAETIPASDTQAVKTGTGNKKDLPPSRIGTAEAGVALPIDAEAEENPGLATLPFDNPLVNTVFEQLIQPQRFLSQQLAQKQRLAENGLHSARPVLNASLEAALSNPANELESLPEVLQTALQQSGNALKKAAVLNITPEARDNGTPLFATQTDAKALAFDSLLQQQQLQQWQEQQGKLPGSAANITEVATGINSQNSVAAAGSSAAPQAAALAVGTSFYHPGWSQAMAQQLATQASLFFRQQANGTYVAQMRLDPPELGPIKVSISIQDGVAQAAFTAATPAVRQAMESALADLHQALQEKGISLGQAQVGQDDRQETFQMAQAPTHNSAHSDNTETLPAETVAATQSREGLINTFA